MVDLGLQVSSQALAAAAQQPAGALSVPSAARQAGCFPVLASMLPLSFRPHRGMDGCTYLGLPATVPTNVYAYTLLLWYYMAATDRP